MTRPLSPAQRKELVGWISALFQGPLLASTGFPRAEAANPAAGDLMHEIGNYASVLAAAGLRDFALAQARLADRRLRSDPDIRGLRTLGPRAGAAARMLRRAGAVDVQDYAEVLLGFVEIAEVTGDPAPLGFAADLARRVVDGFATEHGLSSFRLLGRLPIHQPLNGIVLECLLDVSEMERDEALRRRALACLDPFLETPSFREVGLWPSWCIPSPSARPLPLSSTRRVDLAKANTSMGFALLSAWRATSAERYRTAVIHLVDTGLGRLEAAGGGLRTRGWLGAPGELAVEPGINSSNHAALELLLDVHRALGHEPAMAMAHRLATFWRGQIHPDTGLMPDRIGGPDSFVDSNTDFSVLFRKLASITGDDAWRDASETLAAAVARWHRMELGLARATDLATGAIRDPVIETRYTALYLKALIVPEDADVMAEGWLPSVLRDR